MAIGLCEFESHLGHLKDPDYSIYRIVRIFFIKLREGITEVYFKMLSE